MCTAEVSDKNSNKPATVKLRSNKDKKEKLGPIRINYSGFCAGLHDGKNDFPLANMTTWQKRTKSLCNNQTERVF